jgi:hypothetical protein
VAASSASGVGGGSALVPPRHGEDVRAGEGELVILPVVAGAGERESEADHADDERDQPDRGAYEQRGDRGDLRGLADAKP